MFLIIGELINSSRRQVGRAIEKKDDLLIRRLAHAQVEARGHRSLTQMPDNRWRTR